MTIRNHSTDRDRIADLQDAVQNAGNEVTRLLDEIRTLRAERLLLAQLAVHTRDFLSEGEFTRTLRDVEVASAIRLRDRVIQESAS